MFADEDGRFTAAFISNWLAPFCSVAFGEMYSRRASNFRSCSAPIVIFMFIPAERRPTSVSSILPRKMRSFMFATVAIVVPSLKVLARMTELPTFTGMSSIRPVIVERMSVEDAEAFDFDTPSRTTSRLSCAASTSSRAWRRACAILSYSSAATSPLSKRAFSRS